MVDVVVDLVGSVDPADGDGLEEGAPEERHSAGTVEVHELEEVHPAVGDLRDAQHEHEDDHAGGELEAARAQELGPVVHQAADERLQDAELRVEAQGQ